MGEECIAQTLWNHINEGGVVPLSNKPTKRGNQAARLRGLPYPHKT